MNRIQSNKVVARVEIHCRKSTQNWAGQFAAEDHDVRYYTDVDLAMTPSSTKNGFLAHLICLTLSVKADPRTFVAHSLTFSLSPLLSLGVNRPSLSVTELFLTGYTEKNFRLM